MHVFRNAAIIGAILTTNLPAQTVVQNSNLTLQAGTHLGANYSFTAYQDVRTLTPRRFGLNIDQVRSIARQDFDYTPPAVHRDTCHDSS